MALIHDVVEIDAGDTFCYADPSGKYEKELSAAKRIFGILPSPFLAQPVLTAVSLLIPSSRQSF